MRNILSAIVIEYEITDTQEYSLINHREKLLFLLISLQLMERSQELVVTSDQTLRNPSPNLV